jgi:hypothetical protein
LRSLRLISGAILGRRTGRRKERRLLVGLTRLAGLNGQSRSQTGAPAAAPPFNPNSEIRTADFADFADVKRVSFMVLASDFEAIFVSKLFIRAIRGFNSGFRVKTSGITSFLSGHFG